VHQRKGLKDEWGNLDSINLSKLKAGEGVKVKLDSKQTKQFYDALTELYKLSLQGVKLGENEYTVGKSNEIIEIPKERKKIIQSLLEANHGEDIWNQLIDGNPDLATKLSLSQIQTNRQKALDEFQKSMEIEKNEQYWQAFFSDNSWIFGYGLKYKFLNLINDQPHYGGTNLTGKGAQKGDYLLNSEAEIKFTVLVEIKRSTTPIISTKKNGDNVKYRNGAYLLSSELLGSVSQVQVNCKTWLRKSLDPENTDILCRDNIFTVNPRGIIVIGNTSQFNNDREKIETFEIFRNELNNPEIITFDELFERAKFIVQNNEVQKESMAEENCDDEMPF
jgi:hypothetical protein